MRNTSVIAAATPALPAYDDPRLNGYYPKPARSLLFFRKSPLVRMASSFPTEYLVLIRRISASSISSFSASPRWRLIDRSSTISRVFVAGAKGSYDEVTRIYAFIATQSRGMTVKVERYSSPGMRRVSLFARRVYAFNIAVVLERSTARSWAKVAAENCLSRS